MSRILKDVYIYGKDKLSNFKVGDYVRIKTYDKNIKCIIKEITDDEDVKVEDDDFEEFTFSTSDILDIYDLFC